MVSSIWVPKWRLHTKSYQIWPNRGRPQSLQSFGLVVLEVENSKLEFCLQIKILLYKSTSRNTKMASEMELLSKQKNFINEIPDYFSPSENQCISLIKKFCFATNSNSDAIFVFTGVVLYNRILI